MSENEVTPAPENEKAEKTMAERAQEVGRDGAYLEIDATGLVQAHRDGSLGLAKMVVINVARIELSSESDIANLKSVVAQNAYPPGVSDMSDEQASMFLLRDCLGAGLAIKGGGKCGS